MTINNNITLTFLILIISSCTTDMKHNKFDVQGHRGAKGLMPENSIPAFKKAVDLGVQTLELDIVVSKENQLVVSHDPWFAHYLTTFKDGTFVKKDTAKSLNIYQMTTEEIQSFDCGSRPLENYPEQTNLPTHKPMFKEMVQAIEAYKKLKNKTHIRYNIEIKSRPAWDEIYTPKPEVYANLFLKEIESLKLMDQCNVQSFDVRLLKILKKKAPQLQQAYLTSLNEPLDTIMGYLGYIPEIYSPNHNLINADIVKQAQAKGMRVIPWTINEIPRMQELLEWGVDGIITDYPNRLIQLLAEEEKE